MGHYRSEMVSESEDAEEARNRADRLDRLTTLIEEDISARGVARVLAEIITHNAGSTTGVRYPRRG